MKIFGLEKLSLVDYDGKIASTVFTGACNFKCPFCHNSPLVTGLSTLNEMNEQDVLSYLAKRRGVLEGVCVSGGEPTLNADLPNFIEKIKNLGFSVKLDTNGTNPQMIKSLFENGLVDYVAMDIKSDKPTYPLITDVKGLDLSSVEKSVEFLITNDYGYEFRTTLIKEFHDELVMKNIAEWVKGAKTYALQKFIPSENCISTNLTEIKIDKAKEFLSIVSPSVKLAKLRGYE